MKLYENPPRFVRVGNKKYTITASFDTVLFIFDVLDSTEMLEQDRVKLAARMMFKRPPLTLKGKALALEEALKLLAGDEKHEDRPPVMDFEQDAAMIRAAFMQQYGIDLDEQRGRMSWFRFSDLLGGLTDKTRFIQIVQIRAKPMPAATQHNAEERRALAEAKAQFAIKEEPVKARRRLARQMHALADGMRAGDRQ